MKTLKANQLKKLIKIIYYLKVHKIPLCEVFFLGGGQDMKLVEQKLNKKGIEIK